MDWSNCDLVEVIEGKGSGMPLVKGTRVPADVILSNFLAGSKIDQLAENYRGVPRATIQAVLEYATERLGWDDETKVDWSSCPLTERVPGRCSGAWTIVNTRIFPDGIVGEFEFGASIEEIQENYPSLTLDIIRGLITYATTHQNRKAA